MEAREITAGMTILVDADDEEAPMIEARWVEKTEHYVHVIAEDGRKWTFTPGDKVKQTWLPDDDYDDEWVPEDDED